MSPCSFSIRSRRLFGTCIYSMGKNGIEALTKFVEANANEHIRNQLNLQEGKLANEQVFQGQLLPSLQAGPLTGRGQICLTYKQQSTRASGGVISHYFFSIFPGCLIRSLHCFKRRLIADHLTLIIPATFCFYTVSGVSPPGLNKPFLVKRNSENKLAFVTIPVG